MNPYINSLAGFVSGFIAFWPILDDGFEAKPERVQDFEAAQRLIESEEANRNLTPEQKNAKMLFNQQSRTSEKTATNRKITKGGKGKGTTFASKNRTLH